MLNAEFTKFICKTFCKAKVNEICDKMNACEWEREILLDLLCEPRLKTIESLEFSNKGNFYKRLNELDTRLTNFIFENAAKIFDKEDVFKTFYFYLCNKYGKF